MTALDARDWVSPNEYSNTPGKSSGGHLERYKRILNVMPGKHINVAIGECGILRDYLANEGYTTIPISGAVAAAQLLADEIWYNGGTIPRFWFVRGGYQNWQKVQVGDDALSFLEDYYLKNPIQSPPPPPVVIPPPPIVVPPKPDPVVAPAPFVEISAQYAQQLAAYYAGLAETWAKIAKDTKPINGGV